MGDIILTILSSILVFFIIVTVHEWGHFYFAKRAGILVREFAIGFGPKILFFKKGETSYTLRLFPIGGYVKMAGEEPEVFDVDPGQSVAVKIVDGKIKEFYLDENQWATDMIQGTIVEVDLEKQLTLTLRVQEIEHTFSIHPQAVICSQGQEIQIAPYDRRFNSKRISQRAMAIFAGPLMNFVLAFVLFALFIGLTGTEKAIKIGMLESNSAGEQAGLKTEDVIVSVNGEKIGTDTQKLIDLIQKSPDTKMNWEIERSGKIESLDISPRNKEGIGKVGIQFEAVYQAAPFSAIFGNSAKVMWTSTKNILGGFQTLFSGKAKMDDLGGPVRTFQFTGEIAKQGIKQLIFWCATLSLYLGLFNLLPFPVLDGSRLIFLGIEGVRGKAIDTKYESLVHLVGFALLMLLMVAVTYNDILRIFR